MLDILDEISKTPSRRPPYQSKSSPELQLGSPGSQASPTPSRRRPANQGYSTSSPTGIKPSLSAMSTSEAARYLATGEVPSHVAAEVSNDELEEMDWTQTGPQSPERPFNSAQPSQLSMQQSGQEPATTESPFWYRVPPAPISQAHKLRNPPNQPRLRFPTSTQDTKPKFFGNATKRNLALSSDEYAPPMQKIQEVEFARPKFFAPQEQDETNLSRMFDSINLSPDEGVKSGGKEIQSRRRFICQGAVLLLGLLLWKQAYSLPWPPRTIRLLVMVSCVGLGSRTLLDNTLYTAKPDRRVLQHTLGGFFACLEVAAAGYGFLETIAGQDTCPNCDSSATLLIGGMLVHNIWLALFGRGA